MGLRVGLDIGIASVGWCVLDPEAEEIVAAGVRTFTRAENPKTGASLAEPRRLARSARRRLRRRRVRMSQLRELLLSLGVLTAEELENAFIVSANDKTPYDLRCEGLDRLLSPREWARVLTQMCKRRGYLSMRLSDKPDDHEGAVKHAIAENGALMREKGYRTVGEMLAKDEKYEESKRNKGDYKGVVSRGLLLQEIAALFEAQRGHGNPHAGADLEQDYVEILSAQAPITEGDALLAKVGACSLDRTNPRIPRACPTFERFRVLDKIGNIRYTEQPGGHRLGLPPEARQLLTSMAFNRATPLTYAHVRKHCQLPDTARFVGIHYDRNNPDDLGAESKEKLPHPKAWNELRRRVSDASEEDWTRLRDDSKTLDKIARVLTYYKLTDSVRRELDALGLPATTVDALSQCRFSGHGHLSRETILAILPHMEAGMPYSDACVAAGFHHSQVASDTRHSKLPPIPYDEVRNPVVIRALSQTRKVLNAIIATYGPIEALHVEMARDVARSYEDRRKIEKGQKENRARNESILDDLRVHHDIADPRPLDIVKYKLWKEQDGRCPYTGKYIDPVRMLSGEPGVAEVDHILPHSRSFDDGYMNKVLVTASANQGKRGLTPFEYLGRDPHGWHEFEERVLSMHLPRAKKDRLLRTDFDARASDEFRERNLVDTRYIARYFKNFVEENLQFAGDRKRPVLTVNGRATAFLRTGWQLQKVRADGDLHHALDAAVIAATSQAMVQSVSRFFSVRPLRNPDGLYVDASTGEIVDAKHVPEPWEGFAEQLTAILTARFSEDPASDLDTDSQEPRPILVSRMPSRSIRGEVHKETVRRIEGEDAKGRLMSSKRISLEDLDRKSLDRMVGRERDAALFSLLRECLDAHDGDAKKAFADPVYKPTRPGHTAPRVRSIRVYDDPSSGGTPVRGGIADNGEMVRTDVFERSGKYYLVPIYLKDVARGALPDRAIVAHKPEADWRMIDDTYRFAFSLYMNDLVKLTKKAGDGVETIFGYFKGTDRASGSVTIAAHDSSWIRRGLGVAHGVASFKKYEIDVLGKSVHQVRREKRIGFSNGGDQQ